jgi:hypothetical protein
MTRGRLPRGFHSEPTSVCTTSGSVALAPLTSRNSHGATVVEPLAPSTRRVNGARLSVVAQFRSTVSSAPGSSSLLILASRSVHLSHSRSAVALR